MSRSRGTQPKRFFLAPWEAYLQREKRFPSFLKRDLGEQRGASDSQLWVPAAGYLMPSKQPRSEKRATFSGGLCRTRAGNRPAEEGLRLSWKSRHDHHGNLFRIVAFRAALGSCRKGELLNTL
jgi:hypothetical protein